MKYILAYDIGTTGVKTCLFEVDKAISLVSAAKAEYPLYTYPDGGAEQHGDDWWNGMATSTKELFEKIDIKPEEVAGISFCAQMQAVVLVDKDGIPVHHPMSYMDQRAKEEVKKGISYGLQVAGANIFKLIPSLIITGAVTSSVKDPVWKYKWIEAHEPENFARAYKWLDVKDYLAGRMTGEYKMTEDSAFATLIYDTRKGKEGWSDTMNRMFGIKKELLPEIIKSTDIVGLLSENAAKELGLAAGIPVFGGGGDSSLIGVGSGCVEDGDTHIYSGTSGWVITQTNKQMVDVDAMIAAITGAVPGHFNYFAEMETAGKSIEWAMSALMPDIASADKPYENKYTVMEEAIASVPPGSNGIVYTPWLHGNRCPFEDPYSTAMYFGLRLESTKAEMLRASIEGVFYHLRWMLECQDKKLKTSDVIRFSGGSALSPALCQILSDIVGRNLEVVESPQNVGAVGAAAVAAVGLGIIPEIEAIKKFVPVHSSYTPNMDNHKAYEKPYQVFKKIYKANSKLYKEAGK